MNTMESISWVDPDNKRRGVIFYCRVCRADVPHYRKTLKCRTCSVNKATEKRHCERCQQETSHYVSSSECARCLNWKAIKEGLLDKKKITCGFHGCGVLFLPPKKSSKFCSISHIKTCTICNEEFESPSKQNKITCSKPCQVKYTESVYLRNFGARNPSLANDFRNKASETFIKHYGVDWGTKSDVIKEKARTTNLQRHGFPYPTMSLLVKEKVRKSFEVRHGGIGAASNSIREKIYSTNKEKLGLENPFQFPNFRDKCKETFFRKYGTEYPVFKRGASKAETEIFDFISHLIEDEIILNDRSSLRGKELDIYIPNLKLAIEYNGDYWHSDKNRMVTKTLGYPISQNHQWKQVECEKLEINLIFIWEHDWITRKSLTKWRLFNILKKSRPVFRSLPETEDPRTVTFEKVQELWAEAENAAAEKKAAKPAPKKAPAKKPAARKPATKKPAPKK